MYHKGKNKVFMTSVITEIYISVMHFLSSIKDFLI